MEELYMAAEAERGFIEAETENAQQLMLAEQAQRIAEENEAWWRSEQLNFEHND